MDTNSNIIVMPKLDYEPDPRGLGYVFYTKMLQFREKTAQIDALTGKTETYSSLLQRCVRASIKLRSRGITPDDIVMTCTFNNMDCCVPLIASLFSGTVISALDPTISVSDTVHLLNQVTPKIIFVMEEAVELIEKALEEISTKVEIVVFGKTKKHTPFSDFMQPSADEETFVPYEVPNIHDTAIILFSSGTTGLSKGICLAHHHFMSQCENLTRLGFDCTIGLITSSFYWVTANWLFTMHIFLGTTRIVIPKFELSDVLKAINDYKPTIVFLSPMQLLEIFDHGIPKGMSIDSIKQVLTGGVPFFPKQLISVRSIFPKANVLSLYGQTEILVLTTFKPGEEKLVPIDDCVSCGKPLLGFTYKVVDIETEKTLGPNQRGELRIQTHYKMGGYYKRDFSEAFDSEGWYRTGDIVYYDESHCFYVVDRIKEMLKFRTWHVTPVAIENILITHPAVERCLVIGIPHEIDGDHPMALVVLRKAYKNTASDEIKKFVNERVDDRKQLRGGVKIVESLLFEQTGKVKRWKIRNMVLKGEL